MITELKSETFISCKFLEFSSCELLPLDQKRSSHLISQNSSPHARHVSLDGMSVNHPQNFLEPDQMLEFLGFFVNQTVEMLERLRIFCEPHSQKVGIAGICCVFCEPDSKNAGSSRFACETHGQNYWLRHARSRMLEFLGLTQSKCWSYMHSQNAGISRDFLWTQTLTMQQLWGFLVHHTVKNAGMTRILCKTCTVKMLELFQGFLWIEMLHSWIVRYMYGQNTGDSSLVELRQNAGISRILCELNGQK